MLTIEQIISNCTYKDGWTANLASKAENFDCSRVNV